MTFRIHDDSEDVDFVICTFASDPTPFTDNVRGVCSRCGAAIQWRPYVPTKPKKVCLGCGAQAISDDPDPDVRITQYTADEFARYKRGKQN